MKVRPTVPEDFAAIVEIVEGGSVFNAEEAEMVRSLLDYYFRALQQDEFLFLSAEENGHVLGFASYGRIALTKYNYELNWIATAKHALRGGVGSALLRAVEDRARQYGGRYLNLETSATEAYAAARAFYERHGYQLVAQIADYYDEGDDMLIYRKAL